MQDHIRKLFKDKGFDGLWHWAVDGKGHMGKYRRFRALQRWAQGNRDASHGAEREKWNERRKAYRKKKRRLLRRVNAAPKLGEGAWSGSESMYDAITLAVYIREGIPVTSEKRWATYGNPSSDHWMGNTTAYAGDAGVANAFWLHSKMAAQAAKVGCPFSSVPSDYELVYCTATNGKRFRYQGIAETHGTGPHHHGGWRAA